MAHITEQDTSKERVRKFLELTEDDNSYHQEPRNILPGMFYLALSAPCLHKPIGSLILRFKKMINYPCSIDMKEEEYGREKDVVFKKDEDVLCGGEFEYGERNIESSGKQSRLEEFANVIGVGLDNLNLEKVWLTCLIPKKLQEFFGGIPGIYLQQRMNFKSGNYDDVRLQISLAREGKIRIVNTNYLNSCGDVAIEGRAMITELPA